MDKLKRSNSGEDPEEEDATEDDTVEDPPQEEESEQADEQTEEPEQTEESEQAEAGAAAETSAGKAKKKKKGAKAAPEASRKEELKKGGRWTVTKDNYKAALKALPSKKPRCLTLLTKPDESDTLPEEVLETFAKAAKDCDIWLRFLDSYLNPTDPAKDAARLDLFLSNESVTITQFFGHLDADGISKLPDTIQYLGLAIGSAEDAAAVGELTPWEALQDIRISVNVDVDVVELKPLPSDIKTSLYMPGLTDDKVERVRPAIEALVPADVLSRLVFPSSQLTADGARLLSHFLCVVKICDGVAIEPSGSWQPDKRETKTIEADFFNAVGCGLGWNMRWLYGKA